MCPVCGAPIEAQVALELDLPPPRARPPATGAPAARTSGSTSGRGAATSYDDIDAPDRRLMWRVTRAPLVALLGWFTLSHVALHHQWVFIDNVNLLFHEAGHVLFSWGGEALHALGGTLGQLLWPGGLAAYFWFRRRDRFATAACVWWFGENFMGIGRYMADAAFEELPLVGGNIHDWHFLFGRWGLLSSGQEIGRAFRVTGGAVMIGALAVLALWTAAPRPADLVRDADDARHIE
ncbi:MAG TPA: hypothetical protein VKB80_28500 [Kofleriaceae bacterium]|nr:hypothetical protein [Kofleriaceae bacterium]